MLKAILAASDDGVIGKNGGLPWSPIEEDMKMFSFLTRKCPVIMGRKTWDSLPDKYRPLPARTNIVASRTWNHLIKEVAAVPTIEPLRIAHNFAALPYQTAWCIGGADLMNTIAHLIEELWLTRVHVNIFENSNSNDELVYLPERLNIGHLTGLQPSLKRVASMKLNSFCTLIRYQRTTW